jgi:hypothetical protein
VETVAETEICEFDDDCGEELLDILVRLWLRVRFEELECVIWYVKV